MKGKLLFYLIALVSTALFASLHLFKSKTSMKKYLTAFIVTLFLITLASCGGGGAGSGSGSSGSSNVTINIGGGSSASSAGGLHTASIPSTVASIRFTISASDMTTITRTVSTAGQSSISESFSVPNGSNRTFLVEALNSSGTEIYSGSTTANLNGPAVTLSIALSATTWAKTYGGSSYDWALSVQQVTYGGYITAGGSYSFGAGNNYDMWALKLSASGAVQWQKTYGGAYEDYAYSVIQTLDDEFVVAGYTYSFGAGVSDFWVLRLHSDGTVAWQKAYGGTGNEWAYSVKETSDGGYIIAGETYSFGAGSNDMWILKVGAQGFEEWGNTYGGSGADYALSAQQTSDGGYIVIGSTNSFGSTYDFWVLKLDSMGGIEWQKTYGGSDNDYGYSIQQTSDGGYIVSGQTYSFGAGSDDMWVLKLSSTGSVEWQKAYGGSASDWARSIQQTSDGGYIVAKDTRSFGAGLYDAWLLKLNSNGTIAWEKAYGGTSDDWVNSIQQTSEGGYITAGVSETFGAGSGDFWILRLTGDGAVNFSSSIGASLTNTTATVTTTSAAPSTTSAATTNTSALVTVTNTSVSPVDTSAAIQEQAP